MDGAFELLRAQPGPGLERQSDAGQLANWATKMAKKLGPIRNEHGTGHGRAARPSTTGDAMTLAVDAGLLWSRWALRRLGLFCIGRPSQIVADLESGLWTKGQLTARLTAANLHDDASARMIGLAVGRRGANDTWNVVAEGLDEPCATPDLSIWRPAYRWAAAEGHLFKASGESTLTFRRLLRALAMVRPLLPDHGPDISDDHPWPHLVNRIVNENPPETVRMDIEEDNELRLVVLDIVENGGPSSHAAQRLADHYEISRDAPW